MGLQWAKAQHQRTDPLRYLLVSFIILGSEAGRKIEVRIAGAGANEQSVITGEAMKVPVLPGEEEHMQSLG